ncbi:peptidase M50 [Candidatus Bathyarchaeota archaeon]|nr:peptidase M50 [Candidatus Bathyarchaeota archaeon]
MVRCERCGRDSYMPFKCSYCGGYFCYEHRLPEAHDCTGIRSKIEYPRKGSNGYIPPSSLYPMRGVLPLSGAFTQRELRDLAISILIISAIPLLWLGGLALKRPLVAMAAVGIFISAFLIHELAHKFSAMRLGYWAEFRINALGLLVTLISFFSPVKIVAPGAVVVAIPLYSKGFGLIALAGPLTNILQALTFLVVKMATGDPLLAVLAEVGLSINSVLALFNLLPIGSLDGAKILRWSPKAWITSISAAGLLLAFSLI